MEQVHDEGQVPIVTGGTAYYIQHLFLPPAPLASPGGGIVSDNLSTEQRSLLDLLPTLPSISSSSEFPPGFPIEMLPVKVRTAEAFAWELWTILDVLAPERAAKWHWKDVRKVRRQVEVLLGPAEQEAVSTPDYRVLLFWLHCEREILITRLDRRVDQMVEDGLVDEVQQLFEAQKARGKPIDYSKGIYQAIGYRPISERLGGPQDAKGLAEAIERTKVQTRQFAKKQTSWFRQKLWPAVQECERVELFVLDTSDVPAFDAEVVKPACAIAEGASLVHGNVASSWSWQTSYLVERCQIHSKSARRPLSCSFLQRSRALPVCSNPADVLVDLKRSSTTSSATSARKTSTDLSWSSLAPRTRSISAARTTGRDSAIAKQGQPLDRNRIMHGGTNDPTRSEGLSSYPALCPPSPAVAFDRGPAR
jgi:tRNA A37 N6-isopentenylltransferase MiaA